MKVGVICEGEKSDAPALRLFLRAEFPQIEFDLTATTKAIIFSACGGLVDALLKRGCDHVVVLWDLHPVGSSMGLASQTDGEDPCRLDQQKTLLGRAHETAESCGEDLKRLQRRYGFADDDGHGNHGRVELVCFAGTFDAVFLADPALLRALASSKAHRAEVAPDHKDLESLRAPSAILSDYFARQPNARFRRFNKLQHNEVLAKAYVDNGRHPKLHRHPAYRRLIAKIHALIPKVQNTNRGTSSGGGAKKRRK